MKKGRHCEIIVKEIRVLEYKGWNGEEMEQLEIPEKYAFQIEILIIITNH